MLWLGHSGAMFFFGLLIFIVAQGRGIISTILAHPLLVLLGEISFSLYLIHLILLDYYVINVSKFLPLSNTIAFGVFFIILLLSSYLMWTCIEMPGRRLIMGHRVIHGTNVMKKSWHDHLILSRKPLIAGLTLCCIIGLIYFTMGNAKFISSEEAANITPPSLKAYTGINFGNLFMLRGLDIQCEPDGLHVKLAWESKVTQKLNLTNAIHLVDEHGKILGQADYRQPIQRQGVKSGDIWLDTLLIPAAKLNGNIKGLAIALYDSVTCLPIDQGTRDWGGHRLIIRIDKCPATN
jgi:hypothetical protein